MVLLKSTQDTMKSIHDNIKSMQDTIKKYTGYHKKYTGYYKKYTVYRRSSYVNKTRVSESTIAPCKGCINALHLIKEFLL